MPADPLQKHKLKKIIKELEAYKGRHTELVSVYVPAGYDMNKIMTHLNEEQGTASNIKSAATRKNVETALEKMIQHLRIVGRTPPNGIAVFSGNIAEQEGKQDFRVWSVEPPAELNQRIYRCDKLFVLEPLQKFLEPKEVYGLVVMDRREGTLALLKGKVIEILSGASSNVPGKTKAGGQCLAPDSLIQLADGQLLSIKNLHNPHTVKAAKFADDLSITNSNVTGTWETRKNTRYTIVTKYPRLKVESSKDHMFFVAAAEDIIEKAADELKVGDHLIMPERIDIDGEVQELPAKKYYNSFVLTKEGRTLLKKRRLAQGLLQSELARKAGLTQTAISVIELGKRSVGRALLQQICILLGIDFMDFIDTFTRPSFLREVKLPPTLNQDFAQFLGYCLGDGCVETDRITLFEQRKQVSLAYKEKYDVFFGLDSNYRFRDSKNYHQLRFTSRPLVRLVREQFPELKRGKESEIPEKVLRSPNTILAAFLRGLFDAEGYATTARGVAMGIHNRKLAQQLQLALLRFSILSSIHEYDNRRNPYSKDVRYTIDITEKESLVSFEKYIGFTSFDKMSRLHTLIKKKAGGSKVRQIIVPGRKIRDIITRAGYNLELFPRVKNFFRNERMMGKPAFKNSILGCIKDRKLRLKLAKICEIPLLPVKIASITTKIGEHNMVDISVRDRNFIANGVFVHNSAMRFARLREGAALDFFKKLAEMMKKEYLNRDNLKGIIVGGPGHTKYEFLDTAQITDQVKRKIIAIKDVAYTDEFGIQELLEKSEDILAAEEVASEKKLVQKFLFMLAKERAKVSYGAKQVNEALEMGAVDILLISEALSDADIEAFEEKARQFGTTVSIISLDTREGVQLKELGKVAAILRFPIET